RADAADHHLPRPVHHVRPPALGAHRDLAVVLDLDAALGHVDRIRKRTGLPFGAQHGADPLGLRKFAGPALAGDLLPPAAPEPPRAARHRETTGVGPAFPLAAGRGLATATRFVATAHRTGTHRRRAAGAGRSARPPAADRAARAADAQPLGAAAADRLVA